MDQERYLPMDRAIICFSGCGLSSIVSTIRLMGLMVLRAVSDMGTCHPDRGFMMLPSPPPRSQGRVSRVRGRPRSRRRVTGGQAEDLGCLLGGARSISSGRGDLSCSLSDAVPRKTMGRPVFVVCAGRF